MQKVYKFYVSRKFVLSDNLTEQRLIKCHVSWQYWRKSGKFHKVNTVLISFAIWFWLKSGNFLFFILQCRLLFACLAVCYFLRLLSSLHTSWVPGLAVPKSLWLSSIFFSLLFSEFHFRSLLVKVSIWLEIIETSQIWVSSQCCSSFSKSIRCWYS